MIGFLISLTVAIQEENFNLFKADTYKDCSRICEHLPVSEAFRYKHPKRCYEHDIVKLLQAKVAHVSQQQIDACRKRSQKCSFDDGVLQAYPRISMNQQMNYNTSIRISMHKSCAIVGSGASASGFGKSIDSHEAVVRTNNAPTDQNYGVGIRTTYRISHCWPINGVKAKMCEENNDWSSIWIGNYDHKRIGKRSYWKISTRNDLCESYKGWGRCSTGLWAVVFGLTHCKEIRLFGFLPSLVNNSWQYARYYNSYSSTKKEAAHNYIEEKVKLHLLHCSGKLKIMS